MDDSGQIQVARAEPSMIQIIERAVSEKLPAAELEKLLNVYVAVEARNAEQAFNRALNDFQVECRTIMKNKTVDFTSTRGGGRVKYGYTDLESLLDQIRPLMTQHGFSFSHDTVVDVSQMMTVVCTLRHVAGHRESASITLPTTAGTTLMSDQQRYAATLTFARRYTLVQILGLAFGDPDIDEIADPTVITPEQAKQLRGQLAELGADVQLFNSFFGIEAVERLRAADWQQSQLLIAQKRKEKEING